MTRSLYPILTAVVLGLLASTFQAAAEEQGHMLEPDNQVVCRINTEAISKRDVEDQMPEIMARLNGARDMMIKNNQWNDNTRQEWEELYGPAFADALRRLIRQRVMLQCAIEENVKIDEKDCAKRTEKWVQELRKSNDKRYSPLEAQRHVRDWMMMESFQDRFYVLDPVTRPQVEQYYNEHLDEFQRKEGVKLRLIRVDRFVTNHLTNQQTLRPDAKARAEELRKDVAVYGALFSEVAKANSDDKVSAERGGLLLMDSPDPYIEPDSMPAVAAAIKGLKSGDISKVFEFGHNSWAFVWVEDRRPPGPAPLDTDLFEKIKKKMSAERSLTKENEWFRKALSKRLVTRTVNGVEKVLPVSFFFEDTAQAGSK